MSGPKSIILISGKRKCGKDHIAAILNQHFAGNSCIVRISEPVKSDYAKQHNLDLTELMSDGPYKEIHRKAMIEWSDSIRAQDPGYFCNLTCQQAPTKDIWIVSDIRRETDIIWFSKQYPNILKVKITADNTVRQARGWKFTPGVDDVASECDLDHYTSWDLIVTNNVEHGSDQIIAQILKLFRKK